MNDLIIIDRRNPEFTAIDTEAWLSRVLGSEVSLDAGIKFVAGSNAPLSLPDEEPVEFDSFEEACAAMADDLDALYSDEAQDTEQSESAAQGYFDAQKEFERAARRGYEGDIEEEANGQFLPYHSQGAACDHQRAH